jgi:two-component system, cell cycle response regulator DivK
MTKPLALVFYERLMPGSQLVNRLQDIGYRVTSLTDPGALAPTAEKEMPMVVLTDLTSAKGKVTDAIRQLRAAPATQHIPVIAFTERTNKSGQDEAVAAGAKLVAIDEALLPQLPRLLEQALEVD